MTASDPRNGDTAAPSPSPPGGGETKPVLCTRPMIGIIGVLLGSIISTLSGRITSFGLADIRGAIHASVDEGAWINTAFTVGQMMMGPMSIWFGATFGPRRVLLISATVFTLLSVIVPFCTTVPAFMLLYFLGGLASGTFIPLTISFVLRNLPAQFAVYGVAAYAMNSELSQNISASIEGWLTEHWSWHWIFWQNAFITPLMMLCVWFGIPREPINYERLRSGSWSGLLFASVGFSMIYAALDQGNRLDWLNSGLVVGLLFGGTLLVLIFVANELLSPNPFINLHYISTGNMPLLAVILIMFRFAVLSTALIIPQYMTTIHNFRSLETGQVLLWIALPQFILAPLIGKWLQHGDARIPLATGFALIGVACFMASMLTADWASGDFLPSQIVQAVGQSFGFTALVWLFAKHIRLSDVFTFGAFVQTMRLFGGELGLAFMQTFLRVREQVHSHLIGLHVEAGERLTDSRLADLSAMVAANSVDQTEASARATGLLARAVQQQAYVLSYVDGFIIVGISIIGCLVLIALLRDPPQR